MLPTLIVESPMSCRTDTRNIACGVLAVGKEKILRCHKQSKEQIFAHLEEADRKEKTIVEGYLKDSKEDQEEGKLGKRTQSVLLDGLPSLTVGLLTQPARDANIPPSFPDSNRNPKE